MCGRRNLIRIQVRNGDPRRTLSLGSLLCAVSFGLPACLQPPGTTGGMVEVDVVPGEAVSGNLFSGQRLRATAFVEVDHIYQVSASVIAPTVGSAGAAGLRGVISGDPLAEPVEFSVETSTGVEVGGSEVPNTFLPQASGEVTIEFVYAAADSAEQLSPLESIRRLIQGETPAAYELVLTDLGIDANENSPEDAVTLAVGTEGERLGTLNPGEDGDFFILSVEADATYQMNLEATDSINVDSGVQDRFGQFNFGVATAGGLLITGSASAGTPGTAEFVAPATEEVLLRLTATGGGFDLSSPPIQYAVSVVYVVPEGE